MGTLGLVVFIFNTIIRKILYVERKKMFSDNHINEAHKKIDWFLRISFAISSIVFFHYFRS
ncbi:DUF4181 domain-containing protein [Virgibacillus doumboii]|uniref:DUF4181 domain-containing protein n=1 Tax=Virgibacillus doumboii TaxID=2697503 RepID=UPI003CCCE805